MTAPPTTPRPLIACTVPVLASLDLVASLRFYAERLGFVPRAHVPGECAIAARDEAEIRFWRSDDRRIAQSTSCYVRTPDVDALHRDFAARGLRVDPPATRPWGMRELVVIDPHGNLLKFGQPA